MNSLTKSIIEAVEKSISTWKDLHKGKGLKADDVLDLIGSLVMAAEEGIDLAGKGLVKHNAVIDAFGYFDDKYNLIERIDDALKLPWYLEPFDAKAIRKSTHLLIRMAVTMMNKKSEVKKGAGKKGSKGASKKAKVKKPAAKKSEQIKDGGTGLSHLPPSESSPAPSESSPTASESPPTS